jgi:hypothetical protein
MNMPGLSATASLYKTSGHYRHTVSLAGRANVQLGLAQLALPVLAKGCGPCLPDSESPTGCSKACNIGGEPVQENCTCPPPPTVCGPCLLPTDQLRQQIISGQPIDPATVRFQQTCHQGANTFTRNCERCSPETRISLPFPISDRCIQVCTGGFDPASFRVSVREC